MPLATLFLCTVVAVADGDTLTVRCDAVADQPAQTLRVRLAEIDAPEAHQAFGKRSRRYLAALCLRQRAQVRPVADNGGLDRYGRTVAHVTCGGTDANAALVRAGMAWVFDRDGLLHSLQDSARASQRGLWADKHPVPPWEWRERHPR